MVEVSNLLKFSIVNLFSFTNQIAQKRLGTFGNIWSFNRDYNIASKTLLTEYMCATQPNGLHTYVMSKVNSLSI